MEYYVSQAAPFTLVLRNDPFPEYPEPELGTLVCCDKRSMALDPDQYGYTQYDDIDEFLCELVADTTAPEEILAFARQDCPHLQLSWEQGELYEVKTRHPFLKTWETKWTREIHQPPDNDAQFLLEHMPTSKLFELAGRNNCILPCILQYKDNGTVCMETITDPSFATNSTLAGAIYVSREEVRERYGTLDEASLTETKIHLSRAVADYGHFLNGDCYEMLLFRGGEKVSHVDGLMGDLPRIGATVRELLPVSNADRIRLIGGLAHAPDFGMEYGEDELPEEYLIPDSPGPTGPAIHR